MTDYYQTQNIINRLQLIKKPTTRDERIVGIKQLERIDRMETMEKLEQESKIKIFSSENRSAEIRDAGRILVYWHSITCANRNGGI